MEIQWGDFYFQAEQTTAMLIALIPLVLIMQLPPVIRGVKALITWLRERGTKKPNTLFERIKRIESNEAE